MPGPETEGCLWVFIGFVKLVIFAAIVVLLLLGIDRCLMGEKSGGGGDIFPEPHWPPS